MAPIISTIEVARPAAQAFAYVIDPSTMSEWQQGCLSGHMDGAPTHVGSKCTTVRKIGGHEREVTTEITEYREAARSAGRPPAGRRRDAGQHGGLKQRLEAGHNP